MGVTVVDGNNLEQVMADAGYEEPEPKPAKSDPKPADKPEPKAAEKVEADKPTEKTDDQEDADDVEDEDGTTARQKRELSAKMLKAIGKKHRQVKEAEEFAAHQIRLTKDAEKRATELEQALQRATPRETVKEAIEPVRENFATDSDFIKASVKWGVDQGIQQREAGMREQARVARVEQQMERAKELVPDFETTVEASLNYPGVVVEYMRESTMFAELGYHFAKNPKALEKLVSLGPMKQLVELGKIEATLRPFGSSASSSKADDKSDDDAPEAKSSTSDTGFSPSKARSDAPVIRPLTGGEGAVEVDPRAMSTRQSIEHFQKTQKVNLHARKRH